jgi:hypothetical protein
MQFIRSGQGCGLGPFMMKESPQFFLSKERKGAQIALGLIIMWLFPFIHVWLGKLFSN